MSDHLLVTTTTDSQSAAEQIARHLVEQRLAACVQIIGPVTSVYWWQQKLETSGEWLCQIKTRADKFAELQSAIRAVHTYDVPEIVGVPITHGSADYLGWLDDELAGPSAES